MLRTTTALKSGTQFRQQNRAHFFEYIPSRYHNAILNRTSTQDMTPWLDDAIDDTDYLYAPAGVYVLLDTPSTITRRFKWEGDGGYLTEFLNAHGTTPILRFNIVNPDERVELDNLQFRALDVTGPCPLGFDVEFPDIAVYPYSQLRVSNVRFSSSFGSVSAPWGLTWARAFRLKNVWGASFQDVFGSSYPDFGNTGATGFMEVIGGDYGLVDCSLRRVTWTYGAAGILGSAYIEGLFLDQFETVSCTRRVHVPSTTPKGGAFALFRAESIWDENGHSATWLAGHDIDEGQHIYVNGVDISRTAGSTAPTWKGVRVNSCQNVQIVARQIAGNSGTGSAIGVSSEGATANLELIATHLENLNEQFNFGASTSNHSVQVRSSSGANADAYTVAGTGHVIDFKRSNGVVIHSYPLVRSASVVTPGSRAAINNASGVTYTAAQVLNTILVRLGAGAVADTVPTAAALVAAVPGVLAGSKVGPLFIQNVNAGTLTLNGNTGTTPDGGNTIPTLETREFWLFFDTVTPSAEAVSFYGVMRGPL